jgi:hypothetical protein
MKIHILTLVLLVGFFGITFAQKAPIKFGQITKADLINNIFEPDTSAPAVVLCDYGYFNDYDYQSNHIRILRIKILKEEGCVWANQSLKLSYKPDISGITYNLENGEIVQTKLKKESIFRTKIFENWYETNIVMPNVKVGSIIDLQIMYVQIPSEWDFQQEIPVVYSELNIQPFNFNKYSYNYFGYIPLDVNTNIRWIINNAPAFVSDTFMTSSKNFRTRLEIELEEFSSSGYSRATSFKGTPSQDVHLGGYISYSKSWESVRDLLYGVEKIPKYNYLSTLNELFGKALENDTYLIEIAKSIKSKSLTLDETIKAAYEYTKQISWDNTSRFLSTSGNLNDTFKEGKGNSADINLALVQLLRKLGLDAGPVVLSTRTNGRLSEFHPSINKLNYVIAAVFTEKDTLLLDATEKNCPYYLLPLRALNGQGQYMDKKRTGWVSLQANKKDKQMVVFDLSIEDDLSLKGKLNYSKGDYAALDFRDNYQGFKSNDEYLTNFKEGKKGLNVVSHKIENLDSLYKMVKEEFEVVVNNAITEIDGELYITPLLYEQMKENPFKLSDRNYPIDFGYLRDKTVIVNYSFPQGYTVVNLPSNAFLQLPGNTATLSCKSTVTEGKITIIYKITINKSLFLPAEYADLREFYNQIVNKGAEPIVLKKI